MTRITKVVKKVSLVVRIYRKVKDLFKGRW